MILFSNSLRFCVTIVTVLHHAPSTNIMSSSYNVKTISQISKFDIHVTDTRTHHTHKHTHTHTYTHIRTYAHTHTHTHHTNIHTHTRTHAHTHTRTHARTHTRTHTHTLTTTAALPEIT